MTVFVKQLRKCLIDDGLLISMQDLDGNPLQPARSGDDQDRGCDLDLDLDVPTWDDDHAFFIIAQDPNDAVHNKRAIMVTLEKVAARHGFSLNTKKGKTERVVTVAGKGIVVARRALDWQEDHAQLQNGDGGILRLVDSYENLGTLHDKHLCRIPEVVPRAKAARTVIAAISKRVLRNTLLPLPVRRQAALACVDGVLFSAAPSQRELLLLSAPKSRLLRAVANVKLGPGGPADAELRTQLKVPSKDTYQHFFAMLRPRYVPSCGSPARVSGGRR